MIDVALLITLGNCRYLVQLRRVEILDTRLYSESIQDPTLHLKPQVCHTRNKENVISKLLLT